MFRDQSPPIFIRKIADETGQAILILVLCIAALVAVVAVGGLMMSETLKLDNESLIADNEFIVLLSQVHSMLRDEYSCKTVMGVGGASGRTPQNLATVGTNVTTPLRLYDGVSNSILFQGDSPSVNGTVFGKIRISKLELGTPTLVPPPAAAPPPTTNLYTVPLILQAKKIGLFFDDFHAAFGGDTYNNRTIYLTIRTSIGPSPQPITSCTSLTFRRVEPPAMPGPSPSPTPPIIVPMPVCLPGQGISTNGLTVYCVPVVCPPVSVRSVYTGPGNINGVACLCSGVPCP